MRSSTTYEARHRRAAPASRRLVSAVCVAAITLGTAVTGTVLADSSAAAASTRQSVVTAASHYARNRGYRVGISVLDTRTGQLYSAGPHTSTFASESVVKVMIASRILVQGRMHGTTARRAYKMITQSDDTIASAFYGSVGGDSLINWVKAHWNVPDLGSPPHRTGWWGNTQITPDGLVKLYAKLKADRTVGPWLLRAMHGAHKYGSDGFYQWFGLHSANHNAAIKQGWGFDYNDWNNSANENSTGYVDGDRYAVAILARGPANTYGAAIGNMITGVARRLLPGGSFPGSRPSITLTTLRSASTRGGTPLTIRGHDLDGVRAVIVGGVQAHAVRSVSPTKITLRVPPHPAGLVNLRVVTTHGTSPVHDAPISYVPPPDIASATPNEGSTLGGTSMLLTGHVFSHVTAVMFGDQPATDVDVLSRGRIRLTTPPHPAGPVNIRVVTLYGLTRHVDADLYLFVAPPVVTGVSQADGSVAGGESMTITGTGFRPGTTVSFARATATSVKVISPTELRVVAPAHHAGAVHLRLTTRYGRSTPSPDSTYSYR